MRFRRIYEHSKRAVLRAGIKRAKLRVVANNYTFNYMPNMHANIRYKINAVVSCIKLFKPDKILEEVFRRDSVQCLLDSVIRSLNFSIIYGR